VNVRWNCVTGGTVSRLFKLEKCLITCFVPSDSAAEV
jgi:hypothetical protein